MDRADSAVLTFSSDRIAAQRTWGLSSPRLATKCSVSRDLPEPVRFSIALRRNCGLGDLRSKLFSQLIGNNLLPVACQPLWDNVSLLCTSLSPYAVGPVRQGLRRHADLSKRMSC